MASVDITGSVLEDNATGEKWRGLAIPLKKYKGGHFSSQVTKDLIRSSVYSILVTPYGARVMRPEFGSAFKELIFEPNDVVLAAELKIYVKRAIEKWEPRVTDVEISVNQEGKSVEVGLTYNIVETGEQVNTYLQFEKDSVESARLVV